MLSDCGSCGSDRLVEVELARTLMNCVIEAMALRSRLKTGMLIMSAVEESSRKRGEERRGASKEGILNCRSKNTVYYFSYVTCYIFGYSHWRSRSLQKESIQSTEDIDPIHPNPIHPNPLQRPSNPITSLPLRRRLRIVGADLYSGHGFRRGAAQHAALDEDIQRLGRWSS